MVDPATPDQPDLRAHAIAYAAAGIPVFPCVPGAKTPITAHGFHDATTDPDQIRAWWTATPAANIAMPTGAPGFDVLDVDVRPHGNGWAALHRAKASGLLEGWIGAIRTPSGGLHLHFPGTAQRNASLRHQHLDFRGLGGYVLLPPSRIHTTEYARRYALIATRSRTHQPLAWATVAQLLAPPAPMPSQPHRTTADRSSMTRLAAHVARQAEGNRDNALFWAACRAAEGGATDLQPLVDAATSAGLPERQARRTVRSAQDTIHRGGTRPGHTTRLPLPEPPIRSAS